MILKIKNKKIVKNIMLYGIFAMRKTIPIYQRFYR